MFQEYRKPRVSEELTAGGLLATCDMMILFDRDKLPKYQFSAKIFKMFIRLKEILLGPASTCCSYHPVRDMKKEMEEVSVRLICVSTPFIWERELGKVG